MTDDNPFHLFNTKTMSGIHPGSRTAQANVIRWQSEGNGQSTHGWAKVFWPGERGDAEVKLLKGDGQWEEEPSLRLPGESGHKPVAALLAGLTTSGHQPLTCGSCRWWQPVAHAATADGIPLGLCRWVMDGVAVEADHGEQSALAMDCFHWQTGAQTPAAPVIEPSELAVRAPAPSTGWWAGLKKRLTGDTESSPPAANEREIVERSGVGAGTERCLACHGRIANLGALTLATDNDDQRTVSLWRCRLCRTFFLNDWIDRWQRLDSLETEESYYRVAPGEALSLLAHFRGISSRENPRERDSREAQQTQIDAFLADRPRLLHQIRQGR